MVSIFGFELRRRPEPESVKSFVPEIKDDGAVIVAAGGAYGTYIDLDGTVRTEAELVTRYREMGLQPEIDKAVNEIVNEAIVSEEGKDTVEIILDDLPVTDDKLKDIIEAEFRNILGLLEFNKMGYDIFKRWYIDGRHYWHVVIDEKVPAEGIKELRYIDPRKIRKIREIEKKRDPKTDVILQQTKKEYYIYADKGLAYGSKIVSNVTATGIKIALDSIVHVSSGITDQNNTLGLSYLHPAIKPLNQLRALEDATLIYHLSRAPERRIFNIEIGNLPKMKAEQYMKEMMNNYKNRLAYDASTGEIKDDRKFMCYALDTKIPLLDGRTLELQELIEEYQAGKTNWVYSCDPVTGKFVPGPVSWAGITKENSEVVRVTFDNGKSVVCTPDHKFPVWEEGFVEAKDLVGKSIIPGYRRMKNIGGLDYEQIYKNETKTWEFTHRIVSKWKDENGLLNEWTFDDKFSKELKQTVHHINYDRYDNSPENLTRMNRNDHLLYHSSLNKQRWEDDDFRDRVSKKLSTSLKGRVMSDSWKRSLSAAKTDMVSAMDIITGERTWVTKEEFDSNPLYVGQNKGKIAYTKTYKVTKPDGDVEIVENLSQYCREHDLNRGNIYVNSKGYKAELLHNHTVVSVEPISEKIDVGCITVDLEETYHSHHTYLLDAGVYTKNTMLEDFWFPRREGRGTEVGILSGGTALPDLLTSVEYFQDRLYRALQVPTTRLKNDDAYTLGRATEISRDEVNFSKFIDRIRNKFSEAFILMLERQLVLKKITTPEDWEYLKKYIKFRFLRDNFFTELKDIEIWNERMNLLGRMRELAAGSYVSHNWVRKNILKQSDDEIKENDMEIAAEFNMPQFHPELLQMSMQHDLSMEAAKQTAKLKEDVEEEPILLPPVVENDGDDELDKELKRTLISLLENEKQEKSE